MGENTEDSDEIGDSDQTPLFTSIGASQLSNQINVNSGLSSLDRTGSFPPQSTIDTMTEVSPSSTVLDMIDVSPSGTVLSMMETSPSQSAIDTMTEISPSQSAIDTMTEISPSQSAIDTMTEISPPSTVLNMMDVSPSGTVLSMMETSPSQSAINTMTEVSPSKTLLDRMEFSPAKAAIDPLGAPANHSSSIQFSEAFGQHSNIASDRYSRQSPGTNVNDELSSEIEQYVYEVHFQVSFERTYDALVAISDKIDDRYLLFIFSGIVSSLPRFLPHEPAVMAAILGNILAFEYYRRDQIDS